MFASRMTKIWLLVLVGVFLGVNVACGVSGMVWVYIDDPGVPTHEPFNGYMSKYEITNEQYCEFLNAAQDSCDITVSGNDGIGASGSNIGCDYVGELYYDGDGPGYTYNGATDGGAARISYSGGVFSVVGDFNDHPVTYVSWYGAAAFCNYYGYRLPTEWEWEAVADYDGSYTYGCGTSINNSIANYYNSTHPDGTTITGSLGDPDGYGYEMYDMAGNVWEWTGSLWDPESSDPVHRGGSWIKFDIHCEVSHRDYYNPDGTSYDGGFRVARNVPPADSIPCLVVKTYAEVQGPFGLSFAPNGDLYVGNGFNDSNTKIYRILPDRTVGTCGDVVWDPDPVLYDADGLISGTPGSVLTGGGVFNPAHITAIFCGAPNTQLWPPPAVAFSNPTDMAFDSSGRLVFVDPTSAGVFVSEGENPTQLFSTSTPCYFIAIDSCDHIFISDNYGMIWVYNGNTVEPFATGLTTGAPRNIPIAFSSGGIWGTSLYAIGHDTLLRFGPNGSETVVCPSLDLDGDFGDMAFGPDGALYLADFYGNRILRIALPATYYVDANDGNDLNDGLTPETAFATIQKGIDEANDCETVLVYPELYAEELDFWGKAITVQSAEDAAVLTAPAGYAASFLTGEDANTVFENIVITGSDGGLLFVGSSPTINHLTVVDNNIGAIADEFSFPTITNSIFWNNRDGDLFGCEASYSFLQDGLVAYWKLDEGQGTTAYDSAGDNDGTLVNGPNWVTGQVSGALDFDGSDDYVGLPSSSSLSFNTPSEPFSTSCWIKPDSNTPNHQAILENEDDYIVFLKGGVLVYTKTDSGNLYHNSWNSTNPEISAGNWSHIAITYDGTGAGGTKMYVNGEEKPVTTTSYHGGGSASGDDFAIGIRAFDFASEPCGGLIDEVAIYNRALSAEQIRGMNESGTRGYGYGPLFADAENGDYHLLSERGRYRATTDEWLLDNVTSPCIDGGDPTVEPANERMPNGGYINMGAYGNTAYASMNEWAIRGDLDYSGRVDFRDFALWCLDWLEEFEWTQ